MLEVEVGAKVGSAEKELRCPYCFGSDLVGVAPCLKCGALVHGDCYADHGSCPACLWSRSGVWWRQIQAPRWVWIALGTLSGVLVATAFGVSVFGFSSVLVCLVYYGLLPGLSLYAWRIATSGNHAVKS